MDRATYDRFTDELAAWAVNDPRVVGLVAMGSMADTDRSPDEWSDHDLWVVTRNGEAAQVRNERSWLPDHDRIVVLFPETEHGRSAIYNDGHLVEAAIFDDAEIEIASANVYRVLYDDCDLAARMEAIARRTDAQAAALDPGGEARLGRFLSELVIGVNRYGRGEYLSANDMIRGRALRTLLSLLESFAEPEIEANLDNLDPHRRFAAAFPSLGARLTSALVRPLPETARVLLDIARDRLVGVVGTATPEALGAVTEVLARAAPPRWV